MATTTITIEDTPDGRIQLRTDYQPTRGERCSLAQQATLEIIRRTRKEYGLDDLSSAQRAEAAALQQTAGMPACPKCGNNRQVWRNQLTGLITCHRAFCDTVVEGGAV